MLSSIAILPVFQLARSSWTKKKVRFQGNQLQTKWSGPKTLCETPGCWPSGSYCSHLLWPGTGMPPPLVHCSLFLFCYNYRREGAGNLPPSPPRPPISLESPCKRKHLGLLFTNGNSSTGICFSYDEKFCGKKSTYLSVSESWTSFH